MKKTAKKQTWRKPLFPALATLAVIAVVILTQFGPQKSSGEFSAEIGNSYKLAEEWFLESMREDKGLFVYLYDTHGDEYSTSNNAIRQIMASRLMAELCTEGNRQACIEHQRNLDFLFQYWYRESEDGGSGYVVYDNKSKLGAIGMMLRTLIVSPYYNKYKDEAAKLAHTIMHDLTNADGSMVPFYIEPDYEYDSDYLLTFYSGEAILSLVEYYEKTKNQEVYDAMIKSQDYYIQRYVYEIDQNYYPAYVPWHSMSLNKIYKITGDEKYAGALFVMTDKLLELQDTTNYVGRFYNPATPQYGSPHGSSDGVYTEGLAYAYEIARMIGDDRRTERYGQAITMAVNHLRYLQYTPQNSRHLPAPKHAIGAFRISRELNDDANIARTGSNVRIDTVQHIMDGYRKILEL